MGKYLGINSVMTDFECDEDVNKEIILYAKILKNISKEDALVKLEDIEFIDKVEESKESNTSEETIITDNY